MTGFCAKKLNAELSASVVFRDHADQLVDGVDFDFVNFGCPR